MALGWQTIADLRAGMTIAELRRWKRYNEIEPFGFQRDEARFASLMTGFFASSPNQVRDPNYLKPEFWKYRPVMRSLRIQSSDQLFADFKSQYGVA